MTTSTIGAADTPATKTGEAAPTGEPPAQGTKDPAASERAGQAPRDDKGRFLPSSDVEFDGAAPDIDLENDPFLSSLDPELAARAGLAATAAEPTEDKPVEPASPAAPAADKGAAAEPAADPHAGDDVDPLLANIGAAAIEAAGLAEPEEDAESEDAILARLAKKNPALAKRIEKARKAAEDEPAEGSADLEARIAAAMKEPNEAKRAKALATVIQSANEAAVKPFQERAKKEAELRAFAAAKRREFEEFTAANPGWHVHREAMARIVEKVRLNPDLGPEAAANLTMKDLLEMVAPNFKPSKPPTKEAADAAAAKKVKEAAAGAPPKGRAAAPTAAPAAASKTTEQEAINRTVGRIAYKHRLEHPF